MLYKYHTKHLPIFLPCWEMVGRSGDGGVVVDCLEWERCPQSLLLACMLASIACFLLLVLGNWRFFLCLLLQKLIFSPAREPREQETHHTSTVDESLRVGEVI